MAGSGVHVTAQDTQRAQDLLADWASQHPGLRVTVGTVEALTALLGLRGALAGLLADVRDAAYLEGQLHGQRQTAHWVRAALESEGL